MSMSMRMRSRQKSDRVLGSLLGGVVGMLYSCCLGVVALAVLESPTTVTPTPPPSVYEIEAIAEEDYINRVMLESAAEFGSPVPLVASHLDVRPGGQADVAAQIELGPLRPVFRTTIALRATAEGGLEVVLVEARVGRLPVTALVPADLLVTMNQAVNQQLDERMGAAGLQLVGVTSDETTLHLYLVSAP